MPSTKKIILNRVLENLWIGSVTVLKKNNELKKRNISKILAIVHPETEIENGKLKSHRIDFDKDVFSSAILEKGTNFIKESLSKKEGVVVISETAENLAPSIIASFLIKEHGYNPEKAIDFLKARREFVNPKTEIFNSVIKWAYPGQIVFCTRCNKEWKYSKADIIWTNDKYGQKEHYQFANESKNKTDSNNCKCRKPQIEMKEKS